MISTVEKVLFLKSHDLFSQISGEDLAQIAQIADEVHYEEGDDLFQEGEQGDTLFLVIKGRIRIHQGGRQIAIVEERGVTGEMSLLDSEPRSASGSALTDCTLLKISRDDFNEILTEKVEIAQQIIKVLTRRQRSTNAQLKQLTDEVARLEAEVARLRGTAPSADGRRANGVGGAPAPAAAPPAAPTPAASGASPEKGKPEKEPASALAG